MIHLGDITQLHGDEIPVVDIITGGSPCQDLSVAGKRAGLDGERSGLFMEQIRIVKEMRERDRRTGRTGWLIRPRFMVWENVPGAFSSNKGKDFQAVLTEIVQIAEPDAPDVPMPEGGRWSKSGCLYSELGNWSIAWRVHDAQFWGVPQRRKRIALVADFGGLAAPEILFERKGLSGDLESGGTERQGAAGAAEGGFDSAIEEPPVDGWYKGTFYLGADTERDGTYPAVARSITRRYDGSPCIDRGPNIVMTSDAEPTESRTRCGADGASAYCLQGNGIDRSENAGCNGKGWTEEVSYTLNTIARPAVVQPVVAFAQNQRDEVRDLQDVAGSLAAEPGMKQQTFVAVQPAVYENHSQDSRYKPLGDVSETVSAKYGTGGNNQPLVVNDTYQETTGALCAGISKQVGNQIVSQDQLITRNAIVRRLTPLECERLQGFPDGWTDIGEWTDSKGRLHKEADSPRYKALGNSIALPFWEYLARRICALYERPATMGSLFDGIGGFPLAFERAGAKAVWASEIEEFPIAVTKLHFPEERRTNAR